MKGNAPFVLAALMPKAVHNVVMLVKNAFSLEVNSFFITFNMEEIKKVRAHYYSISTLTKSRH